MTDSQAAGDKSALGGAVVCGFIALRQILRREPDGDRRRPRARTWHRPLHTILAEHHGSSPRIHLIYPKPELAFANMSGDVYFYLKSIFQLVGQRSFAFSRIFSQGLAKMVNELVTAN